MYTAVRHTTAKVINVGTGATVVDTVKGCLGAKAILVSAHDSANANTVVITAAHSNDGTNPTVAGLVPTAIGTAADCSSAAGANYVLIQPAQLTGVGIGFLTDSVIVSAAKAAGAGNTTFEIWLIFEINSLQPHMSNPALASGVMPS